MARSVAACFAVLLAIIEVGSCIKCYQCNSQNDKTCMDPFKPGTQLIDCGVQDSIEYNKKFLYNILPAEVFGSIIGAPKFCHKIVMVDCLQCYQCMDCANSESTLVTCGAADPTTTTASPTTSTGETSTVTLSTVDPSTVTSTPVDTSPVTSTPVDTSTVTSTPVDTSTTTPVTVSSTTASDTTVASTTPGTLNNDGTVFQATIGKDCTCYGLECACDQQGAVPRDLQYADVTYACAKVALKINGTDTLFKGCVEATINNKEYCTFLQNTTLEEGATFSSCTTCNTDKCNGAFTVQSSTYALLFVVISFFIAK